MSYVKERGMEVIDRLHSIIGYSDYLAIRNAIDEIDTLKERDAELRELWGFFGDVPMDPDTETIEEGFLGFPPGTNREDIWHWFDERYSKGVYSLLYGESKIDISHNTMLRYYDSLCDDCDSFSCAYNSAGECRYPLVKHRPPIIDDDGCHDGVIDVFNGGKE